MKRFVKIPFSFFAWHRYTEAPDDVKFLREIHPHDFRCVVWIQTFHDDRELEFYQVRNYIERAVVNELRSGSYTFSCEQFADFIQRRIEEHYCTEKKREIRVEVSEDNVNASYTEY